MNARTQRSTTAKDLPIIVGASSCSGQRSGPAAVVEFEMRVRLTRIEAKLLRCLPIVGDCVRSWPVPVSSGNWRPHPTMPDTEIEFHDA